VKAYETLSDDHKRAIYDDDSISDEEFFTFKIGRFKINMFTVFTIACIGSFAYGGYYILVVKREKDKYCPVDHKEREGMVKEMNKRNKSDV
jgi:DnaJ-class molecular chaperone